MNVVFPTPISPYKKTISPSLSFFEIIFANSSVLEHPVTDLGPDCDIDINHHSNTKTVSPKEYAEEAKKWIEAGAYVVGGCCSTGPEHIKEISNLLLD